MSAERHKYQQLADQTQNLVQATGRPGERLLSIRDFASREHVSISTAQRVYELLELRGLIESRPRSGYYLAGKARSQRPKLPVDLPVASLEIPLPETRQEWLDSQSSEAWHGRAFSACFAIGTPDVSLAGVRVLNRILRQLTRKDSSAIHGYGPLLGDMHLRRQLVQRLALAGAVSHSKALLVTSGGQEALYLAVNACTEPGDLIAVESPAYHGITGVVQGTGRRLIEIPTDPVTGIDLDSLHMALENLPIRALVLSTSAQNPLGFSMDDDRRRALMALANTYDIAVIEDDVYGELLYARSRDRCMRAYDTEDRVLNVEKDLRARTLSRQRVLASAVRLINTGLIRVGNISYAKASNTFGATTLLANQAAVEGSSITLDFRGKSGKESHVNLRDPALARCLRDCQELPGQYLFNYEDDSGVHRIDSSDVNDYLRQTTGNDFTAKDFRTWGGSVAALEFAQQATEKTGRALSVASVRHAAEVLGNTMAVARSAYIHPALLLSIERGEIPDPVGRARQCLSHTETSLLRFLESIDDDNVGRASRNA